MALRPNGKIGEGINLSHLIVGSEGTLNSAEIDSYGDHRIAMASAIGSLRSDGVVKILDCVNVNTSFPNFIDVCREVGIDIST